MGGTLTKGLPARVAASTPVLVTGWNAVVVVVAACQAHCWVLRQPAGSPVREGGRVFLEDTGHWVVGIPASLSGSGAHGVPGGFVRCLRTA